MGSGPWSLDGMDWRKIGKGALLAAGGTLVSFAAAEVLPVIASNGQIGALVAGVGAILLNAARKWIADNS